MRLTLVGYRACGKSTLGRLVAAQLGWPFIDTDHELERRLDTTIAQLFASHGEAVFRDHEEAVLTDLLRGPGPLVLATGGGAVIRPANRERLRRNGGLVAWLNAPAAVVQARLRRHAGGRPSLSGPSPADEAPRIMAQREPWYREIAGLELDAAQPAEVLAGILVEKLAGS